MGNGKGSRGVVQGWGKGGITIVKSGGRRGIGVGVGVKTRE